MDSQSSSARRPYVIGIIGGGQLARMMHQASIGLGVRVRLLAEGPDVSAAQVVRDVTVGDYTDQQATLDFARGCDVVTFDHEHVPTELLHQIEALGVAVRPGPDALVHAQDKAVMRARMAELGAPNPQWQVCQGVEELVAFGERIGWPVIAKTSRGGYDGKGVWKIDGPDQAREPFEALAQQATTVDGGVIDRSGTVIVAEEFVDFARELSCLVVRSPQGQAVAYPVSQTLQTDGICAETITPAPDMSEEQASELQQLALRIAGELGVVGLLAVELMQRRDGSVVVNELAMRPHNTGHWSIDGANTSQFENHLRAVLDLPLGDPGLRAPHVVMTNVLGGSEPDLTGALQHCFARDRRLRAHLYGKDVKAGRKVGHVTTYGDDLADVTKRARHAAGYLMGDRNA
ncbi:MULTISPECIES: 5-(carboxyamino)imidazole ribonucleotide synthase [unclassified Luteococcus]|uniref:5-(carboxyamino)imidazole ribonucleotide synthase n=1 Tax=unclassified Luteococcus TaxID=2639923 RepID=UPI00313A980C